MRQLFKEAWTDATSKKPEGPDASDRLEYDVTMRSLDQLQATLDEDVAKLQAEMLPLFGRAREREEKYMQTQAGSRTIVQYSPADLRELERRRRNKNEEN